jgi:hypothetical protein
MEPEFCPSCKAAAEPDSRGGLRCAGCGAVLAEPFTVCPRCGHGNAAGTSACAQCGADLTVACPGCGQINWSGAERCGGCARELDSLGHAFRTVGQSFELRREELKNRASGLRIREERESQARLEILRKADRRRLQRSMESTERARRKEKRIIAAVGIAAAVFLVIFLLAAIVFF